LRIADCGLTVIRLWSELSFQSAIRNPHIEVRN